MLIKKSQSYSFVVKEEAGNSSLLKRVTIPLSFQAYRTYLDCAMEVAKTCTLLSTIFATAETKLNDIERKELINRKNTGFTPGE